MGTTPEYKLTYPELDDIPDFDLIENPALIESPKPEQQQPLPDEKNGDDKNEK